MNKFLTYNNQGQQILKSPTTTGGVLSANKILALNANGELDLTVIPDQIKINSIPNAIAFGNQTGTLDFDSDFIWNPITKSLGINTDPQAELHVMGNAIFQELNSKIELKDVAPIHNFTSLVDPKTLLKLQANSINGFAIGNDSALIIRAYNNSTTNPAIIIETYKAIATDAIAITDTDPALSIYAGAKSSQPILSLLANGFTGINCEPNNQLQVNGNANQLRLSKNHLEFVEFDVDDQNLTVKTSQLTSTGTVQHHGLDITEGSNIDQTRTFTKSIKLETGWVDTGISAYDLDLGTYQFQMFANDLASGGTHDTEIYSGMLSWYPYPTRSYVTSPKDEITLHQTGINLNDALGLRTFRSDCIHIYTEDHFKIHDENGQVINMELSTGSFLYTEDLLTTMLTEDGYPIDPVIYDTTDIYGHVKLQIFSPVVNPSPADYQFKLRRIL